MIGIVAWFVIRYPFERRAKRVKVIRDGRSLSEIAGLACALLGLGILPAIYVMFGVPKSAEYRPSWLLVGLGAVVFICALWVFRRAHRDLGRNWSITLQIRKEHQLIVTGLYAKVRHPMYTSFLLMGLGQMFLLSNWVAGPAGLVGFAILFLLRVGKEEQMMIDTFGDDYRTYMDSTKRIVPHFY